MRADQRLNELCHPRLTCPLYKKACNSWESDTFNARCNQSIYEEAVASCASCDQVVCVACAIRLPKGLRLTAEDIFDPDKCVSLFDKEHRLLSTHCPMCTGGSVSNTQVMTRLLKNARTTRAKVEQQIVAERKVAEDTKPRKKRSVPKRKGS